MLGVASIGVSSVLFTILSMLRFGSPLSHVYIRIGLSCPHGDSHITWRPREETRNERESSLAVEGVTGDSEVNRCASVLCTV